MSKNIAPATDRAKVYMVLGLSLDDVIQLDDWDENGKEKFENIYESFDEADKEYLAQYIGEWFYDSDQWDEALRTGLENIAQEKSKRKELCNDCDLGVTVYETTAEGTCPYCDRPKK